MEIRVAIYTIILHLSSSFIDFFIKGFNHGENISLGFPANYVFGHYSLAFDKYFYTFSTVKMGLSIGVSFVIAILIDILVEELRRKRILKKQSKNTSL